MKNVRDELPQVFIYPIWFTVEMFQNFMISRHYYGDIFWLKFDQKGLQECTNYYRNVPFETYTESVVTFLKVNFECLLYIPKDIFFTLPCKLCNMLYIHLSMHIYLLP